MHRFVAKLEPVPHGGLYVAVPEEIAAATGLAHGARVRGKANGVAYRSSLMKYNGIFHLGVYKATTGAAGVGRGDYVTVTIELDDQPLPTDMVPNDLARALSEEPAALESWLALAPARRREHVKNVVDAKRPKTRAHRVAKIVEILRSRVPRRRTWRPATR